MKKLFIVLMLMLAMTANASIDIHLTNQTVNGDPVPYEINCGGILSFAVTDTYEADVTIESSTDNTVTLNMYCSPFNPGLVSSQPLPVVGIKTATTHITFYSPEPYNGNFILVANDGVETGYCYLYVDWPLPVELASFTSIVNNNNITLNWTTTSETNNSGFDIERSIINGSWTKIDNVAGNGTTTNNHSYSFTDKNVASGNYSYRLKQIDFNGNFEYFNLSNEVIIGIPAKFYLAQNYPNPFNPSTKISYDLPVDGKVSLKIFDMSGKEVAVLINEIQPAGYYSVDYNSNLASGVYFYSLSANNFTATKKMLLVK